MNNTVTRKRDWWKHSHISYKYENIVLFDELTDNKFFGYYTVGDCIHYNRKLD